MGSATDKHDVRERFAKVTCLFAKNGRLRRQPCTIYFDFICICFVFPECVARVPVSLWGSRGGGVFA